MGGIIHDLKAIGNDFSEGEQVLNVIRTLLDKPEHWNHVKVVLTLADHLKTFTEIQSQPKMEEECIKMFGTPNLALVTKRNRPRGN